MTDSFAVYAERRRAYLEAPVKERCRMIRESYEQLQAGLLTERRARYDLFNGAGAFDRLLAEIAASPPVQVRAEPAPPAVGVGTWDCNGNPKGAGWR